VRVEPRQSWATQTNGAPRRAVLSAYAGTVVHWPGENRSFRGLPHGGCQAELRRIEHEQTHRPADPYGAIAYQVVACHHGRLLEGRTVNRVNAANGDGTPNLRYGSVLALLGVGEKPTDAMLSAIRQAPAYLGSPRKLLGHRAFKATACPGPDLTAWIDQGYPEPEEEDVALSDEDVDRIAEAVWKIKRTSLVSGNETTTGKLLDHIHANASKAAEQTAPTQLDGAAPAP
jgi:hypothetical protein